MFTEQRWNILEQLSHAKQSPLQLSLKLNTTMANVSQQLRLLEASNLVSKEKVKNRDKGKPRSLFSLSHDHAYLVSTMQQFAEKKLLKIDSHRKVVMRIWFLTDGTLHYPLEKLFWQIEPQLADISFIAFDETSKELVIASDKKMPMPKTTLTVRHHLTSEIRQLFAKNKKQSIELIALHDPHHFLSGGDV